MTRARGSPGGGAPTGPPDPTQGGEVKNITYSNLDMRGVTYPIVFYSYYRTVGNPGSASGNNPVYATAARDRTSQRGLRGLRTFGALDLLLDSLDLDLFGRERRFVVDQRIELIDCHAECLAKFFEHRYLRT